jgi:nitrous oxidase accessory protein NosD
MKKNPLIGVSIVAVVVLILGSLSNVVGYQTQNIEKSLSTTTGNWLYVGGSGPGNYTRIQDAIDNASDKASIYVYSGIYNENIVINKSISLIGQDRDTTKILGANGTEIIRLQDCSVELTGFTIEKFNETNDVGISLTDCWNCYIHENTVTSCGTGLLMGSTDSTIISNNTIVYCSNGMFFGIIANITITYNRIEGNGKGSGIELWGVAFGILYKNYITRNSIMNYSLGLDLFGAWSVFIQQNNFLGNQKDATFMLSFLNKWNQNYWNQPSNLPKIIPGRLGLRGLIPVINVDWHPAKEPYTIP